MSLFSEATMIAVNQDLNTNIYSCYDYNLVIVTKFCLLTPLLKTYARLARLLTACLGSLGYHKIWISVELPL